MPVRSIKRRYLKFFLTSDLEIKSSSFLKAIQNSLIRLFGVKGLLDSNLKLITYDEKNGVGIIRCNHTSTRLVRAAIAMITHIESTPISIHVMKSSGTIKSLKSRDV
jgi:RNase P/RNase MRP subunit POP5